MSSWDELFSDKEGAVGEVAAVEGNLIEVFVYPEHFHRVRVGKVVAISSEGDKPMGLVLRLAHTSGLGSFTPMKRTRQEIAQTYPDLDRYHKFTSAVAYTSHMSHRGVVHSRSAMPRLHDLVFLVEPHDLLKAYFKPNGAWDLRFLGYFTAAGASLLELSEFIEVHKDFIMKEDLEGFALSMASALISSGGAATSLLAVLDKLYEGGV